VFLLILIDYAHLNDTVMNCVCEA